MGRALSIEPVPALEPAAPARSVAPFLAIFFASGFAALLYQMVWQRLLAFFGGADVRSVTIIVSAFMAGLGFGSLAGGHVADRLSVRGRLLAFAAAELAIATFGFASVWLYYDLLCVRLGPLGLSPLLTAAIVFVTLLWPTFFMGMSLPLLARALTGSTSRAGESVGLLYGWNTFGAATGSLVTIWWLVRTAGFRATVDWGAWLNLVCAAAALLMGWRYWRGGAASGPSPLASPAPTTEGAATAPSRFGLRAWLAVYALSGFIALSLEILWFRLLGVLLHSNSFTFATLLALYLSGVGLGALAGGRLARRAQRPDLAFLALQWGVTLYAGLSLAALTYGLGRFDFLERLWTHLRGHEPFAIDVALRALQRVIVTGGQVAPSEWNAATQLLVLYVALPSSLILPPTLLMGMSFAFLQQAAQTDLAFLGRRVGWLQAGNIAGSTLGAVLTGVALLQWLGSAWTLRLLVILGGAFPVLWSRARGSLRGASVALAVTVAAALLSPSPAVLWSKLHGTTPERILFAEDGSGLSVMMDEGEGPARRTMVLAHGLRQGILPYGGYHVELGALPVMLHPKPAEVLVIGLGSGNTAYAMGGRPETIRIDCVEIVTSQLPALFMLARRHDYDGLNALLLDGRLNHVSGDGRAHVMHGGQWDVIEADALRPQSAYAGNLYSLEYFSLLARHLKPGGLAVSWSPTRRTRDTFLKAFPHVALFGHTLVGSNTKVPYDPAVVRARLADPFTRTYYRQGGADIEAILAPALEQGPVVYGPDFDRSQLSELNLDLFPRDEYHAPYRLRAP